MLEVRRLSVSYGSIGVIHSVSLRVPKGRVVALTGPPGAGKSTVLKAIMGHLTPRSGQVIHNGTDITWLSPIETIARGIVLVSGQGRVFPELTVHENLLLGHRATPGSNDASDAARRVYSLLPCLNETSNQSAGTLWPHLRNMLLIGRALMSDPDVLLVEESLWDHDPILPDTIGSLFRTLVRQNKAVLLAARNIDVALEAASYTYVLESGSVIDRGTSRVLLRESDTIHKYSEEPPARKRYAWRAKYGRNS